MKALVIFNLNEHKYVILRNAERCSKGNMMKLLMTSANDAWKNDEKVRAHFTDYAEFVNKFFTLRRFFPVTKVDIHYNTVFLILIKYNLLHLIFLTIEHSSIVLTNPLTK